jgi:hypothetical protein
VRSGAGRGGAGRGGAGESLHMQRLRPLIGFDPPVEAHATTFSGKVDRSMNPVVATFTDADPNTRARDYSVTISWGDGQTSAGTVTRAGDGSFVVRGRHVYFRKGTRKVVVSA